MNKLAILSLVAAGALASQGAAAKDLTGWFVNGAAGRANYHATNQGFDLGSAHGNTAIVNAGYRTQFIGLEVGYTDLGSVKIQDSITSLEESAKLSGDGWTVGVNGHFNPTERWYVSARGGAYVWKLHAKGSYAQQTYSGSAQSLGWYAGVGTGFDINRHWSIGAAFDYYKISKDSLDIGSRLFTVGAEYRF